jgi:hypothetical protein
LLRPVRLSLERNVEASLLLATDEHLDHTGVESVGGDPRILRATAGRLESPLGEVVAIASEHDEAAGSEAIVDRLAPKWVVPMHYRTHRIGFPRALREPAWPVGQRLAPDSL